MRNRILILCTAIIIVLILCLALIVALVFENDRLVAQVEKRDKLIETMKAGDSSFLKKSKEYSKVIDHYITNCDLTIDGKKITLDDLVRMLNETEREKNKLLDSLSKMQNSLNFTQKYMPYKDSANIYRAALGLIERQYNIGWEVRKEEERFVIKLRDGKRVDSALLLLPHYRDKISYDSVTKSWGVTYPSKR